MSIGFENRKQEQWTNISLIQQPGTKVISTPSSFFFFSSKTAPALLMRTSTECSFKISSAHFRALSTLETSPRVNEVCSNLDDISTLWNYQHIEASENENHVQDHPLGKGLCKGYVGSFWKASYWDSLRASHPTSQALPLRYITYETWGWPHEKGTKSLKYRWYTYFPFIELVDLLYFSVFHPSSSFSRCLMLGEFPYLEPLQVLFCLSGFHVFEVDVCMFCVQDLTI